MRILKSGTAITAMCVAMLTLSVMVWRRKARSPRRVRRGKKA
jgi:hypothetical protein